MQDIWLAEYERIADEFGIVIDEEEARARLGSLGFFGREIEVEIERLRDAAGRE